MSVKKMVENLLFKVEKRELEAKIKQEFAFLYMKYENSLKTYPCSGHEFEAEEYKTKE